MGKAARNRARRAQIASRPATAGPRTRTIVAVFLAVASAVAGGLILASVLTARDANAPHTHSHDRGGAVVGGAKSRALFAGIPQRGISLGRPDAPVTLVEFADLQCPYCASWSHEALPEIVRDYVRPGKVRIVFRGLAFVGPDSHGALRFALAAGRQDKLWNAIHLLYENQAAENSGWVTDDLLVGVGRAIPGLEVERALHERSAGGVDEEFDAAATAASAIGVEGTPSFAVGRTGGALRQVRVGSLDARSLRPALDAQLQQ